MKKSMTALACGAAIGALALSAPYAAADPITIDINSVSGIWTDTDPNVSGVLTDTISWGTPATANGQSSYVFEGVAPPPQTGFSLGELFDVGTFFHNNNPITGTPLSTAELTVNSKIVVKQGLAEIGTYDIVSVFDFEHWETPNGDDPCADGGANGSGVNVNGCADRVTFTTNGGQSAGFEFGGVEYILNLTGFLTNGSVADEFWTKEAFSNSAILKGAVVDKTTVVPIPAAAWLFGSALIGAVGLGRRHKRKAAA
jgi:hypothetical protein